MYSLLVVIQLSRLLKEAVQCVLGDPSLRVIAGFISNEVKHLSVDLTKIVRFREDGLIGGAVTKELHLI